MVPLVDDDDELGAMAIPSWPLCISMAAFDRKRVGDESLYIYCDCV